MKQSNSQAIPASPGKVIMHEHRCPETDEPLFWSNQDGWVDLGSATVFGLDEDVRLAQEAWGVITLPPIHA